ncbi:MAG: YceI family protein [Gemmatimonadales bacterium]|nr:YceI family protein [Gemmatimonadales bacterium]
MIAAFRIWGLAVAGAAMQAAPAPAQVTWPDAPVARGTLSFDGKSTLGDFTGTTTQVRGAMAGGAALHEVRGWVEAPVKTLATGNDRRDRDLNKSMESAVYPTIRFELLGVTPDWQRGDSAGVVLNGNFVIHGVSRPEKIKALLFRGPGGIHLTASTPMNLKNYKIGGLGKMLGILKMNPDIVVHVDLLFGEEKGSGKREEGSGC